MNAFVKNPRSIKKVLKVKKIPNFRKFERLCDFVTKRMVKVYRLNSPWNINQGYCFIWSYLVHALWKEPLQFVSTDAHVVILNNRTQRYYDSDNPLGTTNVETIAGIGGHDSSRTRAIVDRQVMTFFWAHVGCKKIELRNIVKQVDPTDLVAQFGKPYYDENDSYSLEITDVAADVQRLNSEMLI